MELVFLALLFFLMMYALGSGFPVAFALPGSAIVTIVLAGMTGHFFEGDSGAYFLGFIFGVLLFGQQPYSVPTQPPIGFGGGGDGTYGGLLG